MEKKWYALISVLVLLGLMLWSPGKPVPDRVVSFSSDVNQVSFGEFDDEDPSLFLGSDGVLYLVWFSFREGERDLWLKVSEDFGETWSEAQSLPSGEGSDYYPSFLEDSLGKFHVVWFKVDSVGEANLWYLFSEDRGKTWDKKQLTFEESVDWAPYLFEDGEKLWLFWTSLRTGSKEIFQQYSEDFGETWSEARQVSQNTVADDYVHVLQLEDGSYAMTRIEYFPERGENWFDSNPGSDVVVSFSDDLVSWSYSLLVSEMDPNDRYRALYPVAFEHGGDLFFFLDI